MITSGMHGLAAYALPTPRDDALWQQLATLSWLKDGEDDATDRVYVFTDPNCPYCTKLWSDCRPAVEARQVQLRHVLVGILTDTSRGKAATLLGATDPAQAFADYERGQAFSVTSAMRAGRVRALNSAALPPMSPIPASIARQLDAHDGLFNALKLQGTPAAVWLNSQAQSMPESGITFEQLKRVLKF